MHPQRPLPQAMPSSLGQNLRDMAMGLGRGKNFLGGNIAYGFIQSLKECLYFLLCCCYDEKSIMLSDKKSNLFRVAVQNQQGEMSDSSGVAQTNNWTVLTPENAESLTSEEGMKRREDTLSHAATDTLTESRPSDVPESPVGCHSVKAEQAFWETNPEQGQVHNPNLPSAQNASDHLLHFTVTSCLGPEAHGQSDAFPETPAPPSPDSDSFSESYTQVSSTPDLEAPASLLIAESLENAGLQEEEGHVQDVHCDKGLVQKEEDSELVVRKQADSHLEYKVVEEEQGEEGSGLRRRRRSLIGALDRNGGEEEEVFRAPLQREDGDMSLSLNKCILGAVILLGLGTIFFSGVFMEMGDEGTNETMETRDTEGLEKQEWVNPDVPPSPVETRSTDPLNQLAEDPQVAVLQAKLLAQEEELKVAQKQAEEGEKERVKRKEVEKEIGRLRREIASLPVLQKENEKLKTELESVVVLQKELETLRTTVAELSLITARGGAPPVGSASVSPPSDQSEDDSQSAAGPVETEAEEPGVKKKTETKEKDGKTVQSKEWKKKEEKTQWKEGEKKDRKKGRYDHKKEGKELKGKEAKRDWKKTDEWKEDGSGRAGENRARRHMVEVKTEKTERKEEKDWRNGKPERWDDSKQWRRKEKDKNGGNIGKDQWKGEKERKRGQEDYRGGVKGWKERGDKQNWKGETDQRKKDSRKDGIKERKEERSGKASGKPKWSETKEKEHRQPYSGAGQKEPGKSSLQNQRPAPLEQHDYWSQQRQRLQRHLHTPTHCSSVGACAQAEAMLPVTMPEFEALLLGYLDKAERFGVEATTREELRKLTKEFFKDGVFVHDKMSFREFVEDVDDMLEDMVAGEEDEDMEEEMDGFEEDAMRKFSMPGGREKKWKKDDDASEVVNSLAAYNIVSFHTDKNSRMNWKMWVWQPGLCVLLLCVCAKVTGVIRRLCSCYEEDVYVQMDIRKVSFKPGLGPYAECKDITDLRSGLDEVYPDVRSLHVYHSDRTLSADSFSHIPLLEFLHMEGPDLTKVSFGAFSGLSKLRFLNLIFSAFYGRPLSVSLEPGIFQGLASLEELTLMGISLALASPGLLDPLVGLRLLSVSQAGETDLGILFCLLSPGMEKLETLKLTDSQLQYIQNQGCSGSHSWPAVVLSRIQNLDLSGNPVVHVEPGSLSVFQNLSSLSVSLVDVEVGMLRRSGLNTVPYVQLHSYTPRQFRPNMSELCSLVVKHQVESLDLSLAVVSGITAEVMKGCGPGLRRLSIIQGPLPGLDLGFWTGISQLESLTFSLVRLTNASFCSAGGGKMWNLKSLNLGDNLLTEIQTEQFSCMPLLERLTMCSNNISFLADQAFQGIPLLRYLDLTINHIPILRKNDFECLPALEVLLLDQNKISEGISDGVFRRQHHLQILSLGVIDIMYELHLNKLFVDFPSKLQHLVIDTGPGTNLFVGNITAPKVPMVLELRATLMIQTNECKNNLFPMVRELKVGGRSRFACNEDFMALYFTNLESLEYSANPEKVDISYTTINQLRKLKRLKLTDLNFSKHTDPSVTFRNLTELRSLVLINCRLNFLTRSMFTDLVSLRLLRLYSESPLVLLEGVFLPLGSLSMLVFDHVDFRCDCSNGWLLDWAEKSSKTQVVLLQNQQCVWHYQRLNFLATMERLCQTEEDFVSYTSTASMVCTILCAALGYRFLRWPCVVLFFRVRGWAEHHLGRRWRRKRRTGMEEEDLLEREEEVRYDAFVSFSSRDEAWVLGVMAPKLEAEGEPRLRLCLHHRDFEVGKGIVDNIAEGIYSSRRTVCVLTRRYLRSDWCGLEMRMATHRLLSEQSHRLILIFLDHISPFELSAFHRLAKLTRTRTYLDWPQDEDERIRFWERLRRNIAERAADELGDPPETS
ncbi:hypothetical protein UPYG_G00154620 [Umbra pygmaea]|uniref:TIR domain-containing protein n=1 Tax=Umbra pygmaea TaxID=75934 RepID=A0ABD0XKF4_UMBPY